jgi:hypothetical protein
MRFPLLTARQWQIACPGHTDNGEPGEGFSLNVGDNSDFLLLVGFL